MFRPEANRLCRFFEISALSVQLATRGGIQGKLPFTLPSYMATHSSLTAAITQARLAFFA